MFEFSRGEVTSPLQVSNKRSEPENEFLDAITKAFDSDILELEYYFIE